MMKTQLFSLALLALSLTLSSNAQAENIADLACKAPSEINDEQFKSLVALGAQLSTNQAKLTFVDNCPKTIKIADKTVSNPYYIALQIAAQQKQAKDLASALAEQAPQSTLDEKGKQHSEWLRAIKIACGNQLACVNQTIHAIPGFNIAESPIFCAFTRMADYSVQMYYQQKPKPSFPVACLGNSSLTAGSGLSPMQDWFEAYKRLGK